MQKAIKAVDSQEIQDRAFNGMTLAINPDRIPEAKLHIQKMISELNQILQEGSKSKLYQVEIALFELKE